MRMGIYKSRAYYFAGCINYSGRLFVAFRHDNLVANNTHGAMKRRIPGAVNYGAIFDKHVQHNCSILLF